MTLPLLSPVKRRPRTSSLAPLSLAPLFLALLLSGCVVGPDYVKPTMDVPAQYKEAGPWTQAQPARADASGPWWQAYGDTTLDGLVARANTSSQTLLQYEAQYRQARALADEARASLWPTAGVQAGTTRARSGGSVAGAAAASAAGVTNAARVGTTHQVGLSASWEPDLWGGVRRNIEAGEATAQASADTLAAARLSIQATLVQDYVQLRAVDLQAALYARTVAAYQRSLKLVSSQYREGVALRSDVALAESQLASAEAEAIDLRAQRSQLEHAIAVLAGSAPAQLSIAPLPDPTDMALTLPALPALVPSQLLERRPDIAAAERRVAAANADIGVARAAYFPALSLSASGGYAGAAFSQLFDAPARVWSLGATLAQTLFDGGLRRARSAEAVAAYDATVAGYKQTVLNAFQEVEDNLASLAVLDAEIAKQQQAAAAARLSQDLALKQYEAGTSTYLTVVTAQTATLSSERAVAQLLARRLVASSALITGLGGGWSNS
jgi:NodT family efflux transporter outer membrane factor (OMF) lipoprotein